MTTTIKINVNDMATVVLKEKGCDALRAEDKYVKSIFPSHEIGSYVPGQKYEAQLWWIMHALGFCMVMGLDNPIETDIMIEVD